MASYQEICKVLGFIAAAYPRFELKKETIDVYAELLADIDAELLATAAKQITAEVKFFPTVAEIRERVLAIRDEQNPTPDAEAAWDELQRQISWCGYMRWEETKWSTDMVREVAKMFWRDACLGDIDNISTVRAQFRNAYNARMRRQADNARMLPSTLEAIKALAAHMDVKQLGVR
jgi:hypothetical protein